jgi:CheY-like chemotaxis protein
MTTRKFKSILFVDDEPDVCVAGQTALDLLEGVDVTTACSGKACIDLAYERRPDLIVLDVVMPGLDGPATHRIIRGNPLIANIPVVYLTAISKPAEIARLLALGAIGVVRKPFDPLRMGEELVAIWTNACTSVDPATAAVDTLAQQFLERTRVDVDRIRSLAIAARIDFDASLSEIEQIAHSIHGTGAMVGYSAVSESGGALQRLVESLLNEDKAPTKSVGPIVLVRLHELIENLARALVAARSIIPSNTAMFQ